jgi:hypothetical protein
MNGLSHGKVALALCFFGLSQSGCDVVQGFRNASAAVFPDEKTYFDAPGFRLVRGGYRSLEFASGSSLYLLARPADPDDFSLYVMQYADPRPCVLPNVRAHSPGVGVFVEATTIAYMEEETPQGTVRFADGNCHNYDLTITQGSLPPLVETPDGFLVYQGGDLVLVNPVRRASRMVATDAVYLGAFSGFHFLSSGGRVGVFKPDLNEVASFGDGVDQFAAAGGSFFYHDKAGIHRLTVASYDSVIDTVIAGDGCELAIAPSLGAAESWVTYYSPCDAKKLVVYTESTGRPSALDIAARPGAIAFLPAYPNQNGDPTVDPFFVFYLTDIEGNVGTLQMRTPERVTRVIGAKAAFGRLKVFQSAAETHGYALIDVAGDTGTFVRWDSDGQQRALAHGVVRGPGDLFTDFDGETGDFALPSGDEVNVVAHRVPPYGFKSRDPKDRWTAIINDFQAPIGTLSITESRLDFTEAARTAGPPPKLEVIAREVLWDSRTTFVPALPGIAYVTHYDEVRDTGRLEYRNLELRFTATVSDGVANYLPTPGGLIYSVPYGDSAGIWVVRSR